MGFLYHVVLKVYADYHAEIVIGEKERRNNGMFTCYWRLALPNAVMLELAMAHLNARNRRGVICHRNDMLTRTIYRLVALMTIKCDGNIIMKCLTAAA